MSEELDQCERTWKDEYIAELQEKLVSLADARKSLERQNERLSDQTRALAEEIIELRAALNDSNALRLMLRKEVERLKKNAPVQSKSIAPTMKPFERKLS